ncbi:M42 family metallopeptidase [Cytobacillus sp. FJAT-53684]|uniref:M42 family metallopeptidase n=1 Tax=Cytobacillus mangrovibacter TaxID=3299024 RepID=A0ABW6JZ14_9BACI
MSNQVHEMFKELTEAPGVVGDERNARGVMEKYIKPYCDSILSDQLGSLIAVKTGKSNGPKIMVTAHLDEVGFMVTDITKQGFLKFVPLGGWWSQVILSQRVNVITNKGEITGVTGSKPPHILTAEERKKVVDIKDMFIDIGAQSKEEAMEFGVKPGDSIVPNCPFTVMRNSKLLMAKAWDNRLGCAIVIEVLKRLQQENHENIVYGVASVQEEVGIRGAKTAANVIQPDISFAIDVGIAGDTPGIREDEARGKLGSGPQIVLYDLTMIPHRGLREFVVKIAEELNIPFQFEVLTGGGTDAGSTHLHGAGVPSLAIIIPTRYIHSHASIIHEDDFESAVQLFVEVIKKLNRFTVNELIDKV